MKRLFAITIFILALSGKTFSQCNPAIPPNAVVINTTQSIGFGGSQLWVCDNDTLTSNGGSNTIYLEVGATIMAGGGSNTIYCPPGATVNVSSGLNTIYYVNAADLVSTGGSPILNPCTSIVYDYSNAPTPGCVFTTDISRENNTGVTGLKNIYPNPASDITWIEYFLTSPGNVSLKVFNYSGTETVAIKSEMQSAGKHLLKLETANLPVGIYYVQIETGITTSNRKFAIVK